MKKLNNAKGKQTITIKYTDIEQINRIINNKIVLNKLKIEAPDIINVNLENTCIDYFYLGNDKAKIEDNFELILKCLNNFWKADINLFINTNQLLIMNSLEIQKKILYFFYVLERYLSIIFSTEKKYRLYNEVAKFSKEVDSYQKSLCHGDLRCSNIMIYGNRPYIIDIGDLCYGPKYYDLASILEDPTQGLQFSQKMILLRKEFKLSTKEIRKYLKVSIMNNLFCIGTIFEILSKDIEVQDSYFLLKNLIESTKYNILQLNDATFLHLLDIMDGVMRHAKDFRYD